MNYRRKAIKYTKEDYMAFNLKEAVTKAKSWEIGIFVPTSNGGVKLLPSSDVEIFVGGRKVEGGLFVNKAPDVITFLETRPGAEKQLAAFQSRIEKTGLTSILKGTFAPYVSTENN